MTRGLNAELPRRGALGDPAVEDPVGDELLPGYPHALAIEWPRPEAARAERVVDDGDAGPEHGLAKLFLEKARLAGDRRAADRPGEMAEQRCGDTRIEQDRILAGPKPLRVQPRDRASARLSADLLGAVE